MIICRISCHDAELFLMDTKEVNTAAVPSSPHMENA